MDKLEELLFEGVEAKTPAYVKKSAPLDYLNKNEFSFVLKPEHLLPYSAENPEGLGLNDWLKNYEKEAKVSTAGIRGPQNIKYPHDTRFPINIVGVVLATVAKALVNNEKYKGKELVKIAGCEVRYNSKIYLDLIARIQAQNKIRTLVPEGRETIPIWLISFLAFKLDLLGGEYITSSHGISVKNATKDLNNQGSQYLPDESVEFVDKIKEIFEIVKKEGKFEIKFSATGNSLIDENTMKKLHNGIDLYVEYLTSGVANEQNLNLIKNYDKKIVIENVGGSAYKTLSKVLERLKISDKFDWSNVEEDPFFHGIGKTIKNGEFYDYSVDATVMAKNEKGEFYFPVIETLKYEEKLKKYPTNTAVFITDPDHDRLTVCQIEDETKKDFLKKNGIDFVKLNEGRILTVFTANQAFLLIMDFWAKQLKNKGVFDNHQRFMIKTTASAKSWDEWAKANNIKVVNVPVGFKEIANIMKKAENQIEKGAENVVVQDVLGNDINLGKSPRLVFAGEESGGMIIGAEELIKSKVGRLAVAMREKSATEAILVASALVSSLKIPLSERLVEVFEENKIISRYDIREDISYYNESEPDIEKLKAEKTFGEAKRTKNDVFYLALAMAKREGKISVGQIKEILAETFKELDFSNLVDVKFVGDGTYFEFEDKFVEIRPSGTDAKTKAYSGGKNKAEIIEFARTLGNYSGEVNEIYLKYIPEGYLKTVKDYANEVYEKFTANRADERKFEIPKYEF